MKNWLLLLLTSLCLLGCAPKVIVKEKVVTKTVYTVPLNVKTELVQKTAIIKKLKEKQANSVTKPVAKPVVQKQQQQPVKK